MTDPFSLAIRRLHISVIPNTLPCREEERKMVEDYLQSGIGAEGLHKPIFICGMPGKQNKKFSTATVHATSNALREEAQKSELPDFRFFEINCLRLVRMKYLILNDNIRIFIYLY